jgi:hypothetical protein
MSLTEASPNLTAANKPLVHPSIPMVGGMIDINAIFRDNASASGIIFPDVLTTVFANLSCAEGSIWAFRRREEWDDEIVHSRRQSDTQNHGTAESEADLPFSSRAVSRPGTEGCLAHDIDDPENIDFTQDTTAKSIIYPDIVLGTCPRPCSPARRDAVA